MSSEKAQILLRIDNVLRQGTHENLQQIMQVINRQGIKVILNVTPRWKGHSEHNPKHVEFVREQLSRGHYLALHGVEHRCRVLPEEEHTCSWRPTSDEFHCRDYKRIYGKDIPVAIQEVWLKEANRLLEKLLGRKTNLLFPPAHAFNNNTLIAMTNTRFKGICDYGRWTPSPYPEGPGNKVTVFPFDFEDYMKNCAPDGSNAGAMLGMFKKYFDAMVGQDGFYATFIHCDFSGEGEATTARLEFLDNMITYMKDRGEFVDPQTRLLQ